MRPAALDQQPQGLAAAGQAVAGAGGSPVDVAGRPACEHFAYFGPCFPSPQPHFNCLAPGVAAT